MRSSRPGCWRRMRGKPLRGVHRTQRIAGEVAKGMPLGPVHVLHRAVAVVATRVQAQQGSSCCSSHIAGMSSASASPLIKRALDLEAQDHVGRIGHLVGIHPDQAWVRRGSSAGSGSPARRPAAHPRRAGHQRRQVHCAKPGWRPSCISKARLWLSWMAMDRASCHRLAQQVTRQVLLVAAVAGFVDGAEQAVEEIFLAKTRGQAHVLGHTAGKRGGCSRPAGRRCKVEAQQLHHLLAQLARCAGLRKRADWGCQHRLAGLTLDSPGAPARAATAAPRRRHGGHGLALVMPGSYWSSIASYGHHARCARRAGGLLRG